MKLPRVTIAILTALSLAYAAFLYGRKEGRTQAEATTTRFAQEALLDLLDTCRALTGERFESLKRVVEEGSGQNLTGIALLIDVMDELDKVKQSNLKK